TDLTASYTDNSGWRTHTVISNGDGTFQPMVTDWHDTIGGWATDWKILVADFNGDGKNDLSATYTDNDGWRTNTVLAVSPIIDKVIEITTPVGGTTTITYKPSSAYTNTLLPFIVQTVSSISVNDGNGNSSTTNYTYSGGYFDYADREYRGFQYVKATAPNGTYTETWFKQDDIFKGLPYDQITKDSSNNIYTRSVNTFNSTSPYTGVNFPYLSQKDDYVYDGTATAKQARTSFTYDSYGNIARK
ncbi:MAG: toxin TcdB middle/N-terminal domain-containing protein, partial [Gemmatimonadota bacterium]